MNNWFNQLIYWVPLGLVSVILLSLLAWEWQKGSVPARLATRAFLSIIAITFIQIGLELFFIYKRLAADPFGQYLLPKAGSNYFYQLIWSQLEGRLWAIAVAIFLIFVFLGLRKIFSAELFDKSDLIILMTTVFVVSIDSFLILILGSLFLMIIVQIIFIIARKKKSKREFRLRIAPFLLITALIILVLINFNFYGRFLALLKLT